MYTVSKWHTKSYGEPWFVISADIDNPLELVADVGEDKIRVPIARLYRNIRKERRGELPLPEELAKRITECVNACAGHSESDVREGLRLLKEHENGDWEKANYGYNV